MTSIKDAGQTIFNGAIIVFTISFGLFPFAIEKASVTNLTFALFIVALILIILCGVLSLIFSYCGIMNTNEETSKKWVKASLIMLLCMIGIITLIYLLIFGSIIQKVDSLN